MLDQNHLGHILGKSGPKSMSKKFQSLYSDSKVTAAQYLTECLCLLVAKQEKKELPEKFWNEPYWNKFFRRQVGLANALLKEYDVDVIISSLKDRRMWGLKSFGAKFKLEPILKEKQKKFDLKRKNASSKPPTPKFRVNQKPRNRQAKKSVINRLKELE